MAIYGSVLIEQRGKNKLDNGINGQTNQRKDDKLITQIEDLFGVNLVCFKIFTILCLKDKKNKFNRK